MKKRILKGFCKGVIYLVVAMIINLYIIGMMMLSNYLNYGQFLF